MTQELMTSRVPAHAPLRWRHHEYIPIALPWILDLGSWDGLLLLPACLLTYILTNQQYSNKITTSPIHLFACFLSFCPEPLFPDTTSKQCQCNVESICRKQTSAKGQSARAPNCCCCPGLFYLQNRTEYPGIGAMTFLEWWRQCENLT